jgi:hypothetical protein
VDDVRVGLILRSLRLRLRLPQWRLAERAELSQATWSLMERGHLDGLTLRRIRGAFRSVGAEVLVEVRWRGGGVDRLLDAVHAELVAAAARVLREHAWAVELEVTYSVFGERGSIDLVAWQPGTRTLLIVEVKGSITAAESTLRKVDEKVRLGPPIVRERFGWQPMTTARLLVAPGTRTTRRRIEASGGLLATAFPIRGIALARWLRAPDGAVSGLLLLPTNTASSHRQRPGPGRGQTGGSKRSN